MKPVKSFIPFAKWLLRLALALLVYQNYAGQVEGFEFQGIEFFLPFGIGLLTVLLLIGGFLKGSAVTMISGLLIFASVIVNLVLVSGFSIDGTLTLFPIAALSFYFFASGNVS